jgi:hypothetical protein
MPAEPESRTCRTLIAADRKESTVRPAVYWLRGLRTFTICCVDAVSPDNRRQPRFFAVPTFLTLMGLCSFAGFWVILVLSGSGNNNAVLVTL